MPLIVDTASAARRLGRHEFEHWASTRTVFLSSEMRQLASLRQEVAATLRTAGFSVVMFEDLGGRDEDAERAYLTGVAQSDIYVGLLADRYGTMLPSGRSPTHDEYLEARRRGKRISFWLAADDSQRQGHALDFAQEVRAFHTTGRFTDGADLSSRLLHRLAEIAADDEAPWVKLNNVCVRANRIRDRGTAIEVSAEVRDAEVASALEGLRSDGFGRGADATISTARRAGQGRIAEVVTESISASTQTIEVTADIEWADGRSSGLEASYSGFSPDDQTEIGLRTGLLGEALPSRLDQSFGSMIDVSDPLEPLDGLTLPAAIEEAIGRLLVVEHLLLGGRASRVTRFALGPEHMGRRRLELEYVEPRRYSNAEPGARRIDGERRVRA